MTKKILITAAKEDFEPVVPLFQQQAKIEPIHLPLEHYVSVQKQDRIRDELAKISEYENIVHGNVRNTRFFVEAIQKYEAVETTKNCLNLTLDESSAKLLEEAGIPAVCVKDGKKPIDMVEFMLRLRRLGPTLYPCGSHKSEDIPGLLTELDVPVNEFAIFELKGPGKEAISAFKKKLGERLPDVILFHSRRSVTRTLTAFPDLDLNKATIITADRAVTEKLKQKKVATDIEAEGSWNSILKKISNGI